MAEKRTCDHCGLPIAEYDAGQMAVMLRTEAGMLIELRMLPNQDGSKPMVRVGCVKELVAKAELLFPQLASGPKVLDMAARGGK
jgi:hypothetical protein